MNKNVITYIFIITLLLSSLSFSQTDNTLWYNKSAEFFEEALALGNGKTGATVFGGIQSDQIYLNDVTLWAGEPVDPNMNPDAYKNIPAIREALNNEDYRGAERLNRNIQGKFSESYAPLGTLHIEFEHDGAYENYYRELDISKAIAKVNYSIDGIEYTREYFISYPDKVIVIKLSCSQKEALNFSMKFDSLLKYATSANDQVFQVDGYAPYHAEPDYQRVPDPVRFDENRGTRFSTYIKIKNEGGQVVVSDSEIKVSNTSEATLYISIATSFNGFDKDPAKDGLDNKALAKEQLTNAFAKNYESIKQDHLKDYQSYFNRVKLEINDSKAPDLPTDERLKRYSQGAVDNSLEALYFQYGRYLLISSSRTNEVPANLQGIWNPHLRPPWSSNYTMNINVEENYWLAECANLAEMHMPFLSFINNLAATGKVTAKNFYGIDQGWAACHNSDIWAMSNPVGGFGQGDPSWACWNMSGTWAITHLWEHYLFTGDKEFLKNYAYPLMKGAAEFCLAWLVKDKQGFLVTSPSTSPENKYRTPEGFVGATLYGATSDIAMIRECFEQTIQASEELNIDTALRQKMKTAVSQLYPYQIGKKGNLQEWYHDWEDVEPQHRHQTHLFGLYPGHQIIPEKTPELAQAARKTLEIKGDESTGWSKGWRINLWARLRDGNHAYKMFRELLSYVEPDGARGVNYTGGGGTYPNFFDAHPPFQIDGNFGGAAGVVEMLLQSDDEGVYLLPALPDVWYSGSVSGICARGGFELSMKWKEGMLTDVTVLSKAGKNCCLHYKDKTVKVETEKGNTYSFDTVLKLK